ncbi:MAG: DNA polymerase Y family protein [Acidobacteria bacterium]|nr:MAG: DNA polymerase Y family protein [Acidobacteriota bacterium]
MADGRQALEHGGNPPHRDAWIPACAGMTEVGQGEDDGGRVPATRHRNENAASDLLGGGGAPAPRSRPEDSASGLLPLQGEDRGGGAPVSRGRPEDAASDLLRGEGAPVSRSRPEDAGSDLRVSRNPPKARVGNESGTGEPPVTGTGTAAGESSPQRTRQTQRKKRRKKVRQRTLPNAKRPLTRLRGATDGASAARIACATVPLFPLAARLRCEPDLRREAVAVFEGNGSHARVIAATRLARQAGVRPGMTLQQARARLPKLLARARDPQSEQIAREVLLEVCERFTPRLEIGDLGEGAARDDGGTVYLDIQGLERHYRHAERDPELELAHELMRQLDAAGLPVRVGVASSKLAARVAAGLPNAPHLVPPGEEASFLAPLPLHRLCPETEVAETLSRWGIESIGDLAELPRDEVASRLGDLGQRLHLTARGIDPRPLVVREPPQSLREGMTLEWPVVQLEPFLFIARTALERLCERLAQRGLGCRRLEISLQLEPDGYHERSIELPSPTREAHTLLTLVRLDLEAHTPGAPINGFQLIAHPDTPKLAQLSLLGPASLSPDRLATTLARLFALLGPGRVGSPRPAPGHRPERFRLVEYVPPPPPKVRTRIEPGRGLLAVRVLRPALELEVLTRDDATRSGRASGPYHHLAAADEVREPGTQAGGAASPRSTSSATTGSSGGSGAAARGHRGTASGPDGGASADSDRGSDPVIEVDDMARHPGIFRRCPRQNAPPTEVRSLENEKGKPKIDGAVRVASGPWELEEDWWSSERTERDYWDVELSDGGLYRIYHERREDRWYADGIYD